MAANVRTRAQRDLDLEKLRELRLGGASQSEMATAVGISPRMVSHELAKLDALWQQSLENAHVEKARELARINRLERIYNQAWERSLEEKTTTATERVTSATPAGQTQASRAGDRNKAAVRKEARDGNPVFLAGIQWCIEQRCRIYGHLAPKRITLETLGAVLESLPTDLAFEVRAVIVGNAGAPGPSALPGPVEDQS